MRHIFSLITERVRIPFQNVPRHARGGGQISVARLLARSVHQRWPLPPQQRWQHKRCILNNVGVSPLLLEPVQHLLPIVGHLVPVWFPFKRHNIAVAAVHGFRLDQQSLLNNRKLLVVLCSRFCFGNSRVMALPSSSRAPGSRCFRKCRAGSEA